MRIFNFNQYEGQSNWRESPSNTLRRNFISSALFTSTLLVNPKETGCDLFYKYKHTIKIKISDNSPFFFTFARVIQNEIRLVCEHLDKLGTQIQLIHQDGVARNRLVKKNN